MKEAFDPTKHVPVLLPTVLAWLGLTPGKCVVDATLGGGGHTRALLEQVLPSGLCIALDSDREALERFKQRATQEQETLLRVALLEKRLRLVRSNYSAIAAVLKAEGIAQVDAILADLGFSSDQIEQGERGMSFQQDGPLDMRLDQTAPLTAEHIVNTFSGLELTRILRDYGGEQEAHSIARAIVKHREEKPLQSTSELRQLIEAVYPPKLRWKQKIHPATKTFQALRIVVNDELGHLKQFLNASVPLLASGGRLAIITFHSGEDRLVKQFFQESAQGCICPPGFPVCQCGQSAQIKILTKRALTPTPEEEKNNPRSRSAKLRVIEKI